MERECRGSPYGLAGPCAEINIRVSNKRQVTDWRLEWTNVEGYSRSLKLGNGLVEVINLKGDTTLSEAGDEDGSICDGT